MAMQWRGVMPAMTTAFRKDLTIDHTFLAKHCRWLIDNGCTGVVVLGSLGEGATLTPREKVAVIETCVKALKGRAPVGWIAGLVNEFPKESVELFENSTFERYRWFLPLLRMDTVPKFVQLIKLVQEETGMGSQRVRPPRMELTGEELEAALAVIVEAMASR